MIEREEKKKKKKKENVSQASYNITVNCKKSRLPNYKRCAKVSSHTNKEKMTTIHPSIVRPDPAVLECAWINEHNKEAENGRDVKA